MQFPALLTALLAAAASVDASALRKHAKWHQKRAHLLDQPAAPQPVEKRQYATPSLNSKTAPYAVNGSGIPEIDFDIGESYAGSLPLSSDGSDNRTLWFWYVPSTNPAAKNEITIWLNGGPGCSSLDGWLHENGPAIWQPGTYRPVANEWSYRNLTNTVWVDQPVGTGFSTGQVTATDEVDVAQQFRGFWRNFVDLFDLQHRDVYVTGESYAGQYVPYIADGFLNQSDTTYYNVKGIQVFDPSIGYDSITEEVPTLAFTEWNHNDFPYNSSFKASLQNMSASCGYDSFLEQGLVFPPKGPLPPQPGVDKRGNTRPDCDVFDNALNAIMDINPCFDIYQVGSLCPILWDVLGFPYSDFYFPPGFNQPYFNRTDVKKAIHAPLDTNWMICTDKNVFLHGNDLSLPSAVGNGPMKRVIEKTNNVIVGHGALDMVLILNGTLLTLQNLTWNGAQGLSAAPTKPFYVPYHNDTALDTAAGGGVFGSWQHDRGLTFVSVALSGHEVPEFQPSAAYRILELLLGRINNLSQIGPFTTRPGEANLNPQQPLGEGTAPLAPGV